MLTAENVIKSYHDNGIRNTVLKNVSLSIESGDFVTIVGRSGSGKSTLLNILSTLLRPEAGCVKYNGVDITSSSGSKLDQLRHRDFSMVFQFHHLFPYLTALENVLLPFMNNVRSVTAGQRRRAIECLGRVGLAGMHDRLPGQLSGGEQQRVAIARALVKSPRVLFADEPTGNLDKNNGNAIIKLLRELNAEGLTVVMVTHERAYDVFVKRVIEMEDGVIKK